MEGTIGEIRLFTGDFEPRAWAYCDGRSMSMKGNTALYGIVGRKYGGDGRLTFNLPTLKDLGKAHYIICLNGIYPQSK